MTKAGVESAATAEPKPRTTERRRWNVCTTMERESFMSCSSFYVMITVAGTRRHRFRSSSHADFAAHRTWPARQRPLGHETRCPWHPTLAHSCQKRMLKRRCSSALPSLRATPSNSQALARSWTVSVCTFVDFSCAAFAFVTACACALAVFLCSLGLICSSMSARAWLRALRMSVRDLRGQDPQVYSLFCSPHRYR